MDLLEKVTKLLPVDEWRDPYLTYQYKRIAFEARGSDRGLGL